MKLPPEQERLLSAVLDEAATTDFHAELLGLTIQSVRRHRQWRRIRTTGLVVGCLSLALSLFWPSPRPHSPATAEADGESPKAYANVSTRPMDPTTLVRTRPGEVPIFTTRSTPSTFRTLTDKELLQLLKDREAVLVRYDSHHAEVYCQEGLVVGGPAAP